ncbi:MAG: mechanosensitive ion channel family protein, partial [Bacteroidetes bacterium]|nr:mechanosensitive ion channel family protein [Bacteroidota bacterium]
GIFLILSGVFRLDIGTLVAGIGIGGLALALAAKESLENLLASFTIFLDKPFVLGDLVQVGGILGVVEKVGFRSTRLRTLERSFLTIPNKKMVDTELDNLSLRTFRRARFSVGLIYQTTQEQISLIVNDIQEFIDQHPNTNQEGKVRFTEFGSSSLDIMVQYFVDTMDWDVFLNVKQEINFKIMEIVKKHGSDFAYPSTTVFLNQTK